MASEVYDILRCEGIVRIDGFVRGEEIIMLEVNTTPGMTANSFVPKMVRVMGLPLRDVITGIIEEKLSGTDLFHGMKSGNRMYYNRASSLQINNYDSRKVMLTVRYKFNATRNKYKGSGAGESEKERL